MVVWAAVSGCLCLTLLLEVFFVSGEPSFKVLCANYIGLAQAHSYS